ncbi:hypothetical protein ADK55_16935 [Streptomyces sp. WM4235]|nr:hypothetical protein ADK55_16935 [Streptomyces sp. WM4235]
MTNISDAHVKVHFRMDVDEDGWPPASVESLWAVNLGDGTVRLDNTPWWLCHRCVGSRCSCLRAAEFHPQHVAATGLHPCRL